MIKSDLRLGELLIKEGLISDEQLKQALAQQKRSGGKLGEILIQLYFVSESQIAGTLSKQLGIVYASMDKGLLTPNVHQNLDQLIPEEYARKHFVLPLSRHENNLTVAMHDPLDLIVIDDLSKMTGCDVSVVVATKSELTHAFDGFYHSKELMKQQIEDKYISSGSESSEDREKERVNISEIVSEAEEAPIVKFVDLILMEAIEQNASDIHIERFENRTSIRYRIDGVLYEMQSPNPRLYFAIVSRIKILGKMDIAERRLPQDGGFSLNFKDKVIDLRVSSIPAIFGEKVVMRLLDKTMLPLSLELLGFEKNELEILNREIYKPYGMIFSTGPTGCGKSTSLYAILNTIKSPKKNIVTVEDPVEYKLDGINQVQVKPLIGLNFANALRAFLRQDPDIMMVGEVRDLETAQMCIRAALTGHLVLSTLHTNDAPTAVSRIMDIGVEPFLLICSLNLVIAQRLIRKLCPNCKQQCLKDSDTCSACGHIFISKKCLHCKKDIAQSAFQCQHCG
ncbi:MAG: Flp pilus assembly complex ATPase component TadA, partial [Gammaproteobacteria bacterium]|nr:Flp pilus assembly complex ATPase component TadA [Gammaproteobacteria bacterium]